MMSDDKKSTTTTQQPPMQPPSPPPMPTKEVRDGNQGRQDTRGKPNGK